MSSRFTIGICSRAMCAAVVLGLSASAPAANLLPEGGDFEAGVSGIGFRNSVLIRNWDKYQPPVIDSTTAGQGQRSLKITNASGQDVYQVLSRTMQIDKPSGPVSISFWARSDTPGAVVDARLFSGHRPVASKNFRLTGQWQRFQFTQEAPEWEVPATASTSPGLPHRYYLGLFMPSTSPWKTIWLDGLQVELGPVTPYTAPAPVTLDFSVDRPITIYHPDEAPQITLHAAGKGIAGQSVTVQVEELLSGTSEPPQQLKLQADGDADHAKVALNLQPRTRGSYRLVAKTADGSVTQYRGFGVIESLASRPHAQRAFFGGSIESMQTTVTHSSLGFKSEREDTMFATSYSPDMLFALARDLGWGWWHAYWPHSPFTLQPDGKEFLWRDVDTVTDLARKHDLEIMANLAAHGGTTNQMPKWMKGDKRSLGGTARGKGSLMVDPAKFGAYSQAVAAHYKDRIKMWEPWNEPAVKMRAEEYLPLLKASYAGIKQADPQARVYGLCGTWDVGGDLYGWVRQNMQLGAADYMDAISIHGYHVKERRYAARVREIAQEVTGRVFAVADTEAGPDATFTVYPYLLHAFEEDNRTVESTATTMLRLYVNELANGAERGSWFNLTSYYSNIHAGQLQLLEHDGSPTPAMISYNTLIDLLGPSKHFKAVPMGGDVAVEVFADREGKGLAVLWADVAPQTLRIPLAAGAATLLDLRGVSYQPTLKEKQIELPLTKRPVYLCSTLSPQELADVLGKTTIVGLDEVVITRAGLSRTAEGRPALVVNLLGKSAQPQAGAVEIAGFPQNWKLATARQTYEPIPLNQTVQVYFPLSEAPAASGDVTLNIAVDTGSKKITREIRLAVWSAMPAGQETRVDGQLGEWQADFFRPVNPKSPWSSAAVSWNEKGVFVAIRSQDETPLAKLDEKTPFASDSLELYFNPSLEQSFAGQEFVPGDAQVILPVRGSEDPPLKPTTGFRGARYGSDVYKSPRMIPDKIQFASNRTAEGYTLEAFIPWENFPETFSAKPGEFMGFSMSVRDVEQNRRDVKRAIWAGDQKNYRTTAGYGVLLLSR